ncbi:metalloregulator ArsR/SmtB family transcription factor [Leifsonia lichenia]
MGVEQTDQLSAVFAALADPTRREILLRLQDGDASVSELAEPFAMSQPAISKHLKVLEHAGLVSRSRVATTRLSHLEAEPLREATEWMQRYKRFWNASFDRLDAAIAAFQQQERRHEHEPVRDREPGSMTGHQPHEEEEAS